MNMYATHSNTQSPRLSSCFQPDRTDPVMSLFLTAGFPTLDDSLDLILGFEQNGADIIELGMPFSDPLADGPSIQFASQTAIRNGVTISWILDLVREVRKHSSIPIVLMGYLNPLLHYGSDRLIRDAAEAGVDGFILPDLPVGEMPSIAESIRTHGMDLIQLVAPNTSAERMKEIDEQSSGFVYCVSVTGVTGAREGEEVARSVDRFIDRVVENVTLNPKMIGFGIKNHENAMQVSKRVQGFIVGSALVERVRATAMREADAHQPELGHMNAESAEMKSSEVRSSADKTSTDWKEDLFRFVRHLKFGD